MQNPSKRNNTRERERRQVDLDPLDEIENIEKERCRLLIDMTDLETKRQKTLMGMTDNFVLWGKLISRTKKLIEEQKRKKFLQNTHEVES